MAQRVWRRLDDSSLKIRSAADTLILNCGGRWYGRDLHFRMPQRRFQSLVRRRARKALIGKQIRNCGIRVRQVKLGSVNNLFFQRGTSGDSDDLRGMVAFAPTRTSRAARSRTARVLRVGKFIPGKINYVVLRRRSWLERPRREGGVRLGLVGGPA